MRESEMPAFGILNGIKVVNCAAVVAAPFACALFSDHGAEVVHVESAIHPDLLRNFGKAYNMEHRNQRNLALNWVEPAGKEILLKLIDECDILIESSKAHSWDKWGMSDEYLWSRNPDLVIAHITGFGQTGDPAYVKKAAFDMVGQAFGGYMAINGMADPLPPYAPKPYTCDYFTGFTTAWSTLAALLRARQTGQGESIDVAMYEAVARVQGGNVIDGFTYGKQPVRNGSKEATAASDVLYHTADDAWVVINVGSAYGKMIDLLGLTEDHDYDDLRLFIPRNCAAGEKYIKALHAYTEQRNADDILETLSAMNIGCSLIMTYDRMKNHPHYQARDMVLEWYDPIDKANIKGLGIVPKFKNQPGQVFRGSPTYGMDNDDVLLDLGYSEQKIAELYQDGILAKEKK